MKYKYFLFIPIMTNFFCLDKNKENIKNNKGTYTKLDKSLGMN